MEAKELALHAMCAVELNVDHLKQGVHENWHSTLTTLIQESDAIGLTRSEDEYKAWMRETILHPVTNEDNVMTNGEAAFMFGLLNKGSGGLLIDRWND